MLCSRSLFMVAAAATTMGGEPDVACGRVGLLSLELIKEMGHFVLSMIASSAATNLIVSFCSFPVPQALLTLLLGPALTMRTAGTWMKSRSENR